MARIEFLNDDGVFVLDNPEAYSGLYLPLASRLGLKSAITPNFGGDSKLDQAHFLLEPVSIDNLRDNRATRNFWCRTEQGVWSATGASAAQEAERFTPNQDKSSLIAGPMWQQVTRTSSRFHLRSEITAFVPPEENTELFLVRIVNTGTEPQSIHCTAAIPLYGRSADNLRDHRHVTSLLHRIRTTEHGVLLRPTMSFDERGHKKNETVYYALGAMDHALAPEAFFPTVASFVGEGGSLIRPRAVFEELPGRPAGAEAAGREAMGAFRFPIQRLEPGQSMDYVVLLGISDAPEDAERVFQRLGTPEQARKALEETKRFWQEKLNLRISTGSKEYDRWLRWVSFQPFLRRIYGCSFLPHHDYGRGGRGWRDLWQDCLSLLLMEPRGVREMIAVNFGGVRIDGTNATIIGTGDGNFVADRNGIARVWMDHALWPLMTVRLYVDQTGDLGILEAQASWFKDSQSMRGTQIDELWKQEDGNRLLTQAGSVYQSSLLEHLLVQHLTAYFEVGEHNILRLRSADWNDAMDMAPERGESVAFTAAYAGNLRELAALLRDYGRAFGRDQLELPVELLPLLGQSEGSPAQKTDRLRQYCLQTAHQISGKRSVVRLERLAVDLEEKASTIAALLRRQEWIDGENGEGWFNSYYDNHGCPAEGLREDGTRMMLIGQVFAIMSGTATKEQTQAILKAADHWLYFPEIGGYRLNTDYRELKLDLGRMFGFAYGEKENGAVFSHMAVMFANALFRQGFAREGWKALRALADTAMDFNRAKIYPGIPEYFSADGRGQYHYLTGAASWYLMTVLTQSFGVRGELGDLVLEPKLLREQFDSTGKARVETVFGGKRLNITYMLLSGQECGAYRLEKAFLVRSRDTQMYKLPITEGKARLERRILLALPEEELGLVCELF